MAIWNMRTECWKTKATDTHSEYVKFFVFPLQQWLHERATNGTSRTLCIFISVINQLDGQNFVLQKVYFMPLHVSSTCARSMERHEINLL